MEEFANREWSSRSLPAGIIYFFVAPPSSASLHLFFPSLPSPIAQISYFSKAANATSLPNNTLQIRNIFRTNLTHIKPYMISKSR